ncbi:MAG: hypothetical protein IPP91_04890 [Betaproteobacteria bacterium]|nr:hypothetical protein [Betaproteobacteria bacterium]
MNGSAGLAYQCLRSATGPDELQPRESGAGLSICFDGRLDNRDEIVRDLAPELNADAEGLADSSLALACYRRYGEGFAAQLNGDFALALFDTDARRLVLARDVMGMRPLYYGSSRDTFIAASEIKAILAHPDVEAQPDDDALADALVGGNPNELRITLFRDVRRVLPGQTVVVTPEGMKEFQHWDFDPTRQVRLGSFAEYAEALRGLFEQAVRRRLRAEGAVAVTVSGGLDSSAILCQADLLGRSGSVIPAVHGISRLYPEGSAADERRYLDAIEAQHRIAIRRLPPSPNRTATDNAWPWRMEYPELPGGNDLDCLEAARELGCSVVLDGFMGDQVLWTAAPFYEDLRAFHWLGVRRKFRSLCESMTDCTPQGLRQEILHGFARDLAPDALLVPYRAIRRAMGRSRAPNWYSENLREIGYRRGQMQRRLAAPFASKHTELSYTLARSPDISMTFEKFNKVAAWYGMERAYPFADRDLVAFLMAIPGDVVQRDGVYKGLFREAMRGILPEAIRLRYSKADFTQEESDAASALSATGLDELFGPGSQAVSRGYVDAASLPAALIQVRAQLSDQDFLPSKQLNELVSFERWLRSFFDSGRPDNWK